MICPKCGHPITQDFGFVTCSKCQSVLSIDMDGSISVAEEAPPVSLEPRSFEPLIDFNSPAENTLSRPPEVLPEAAPESSEIISEVVSSMSSEAGDEPVPAAAETFQSMSLDLSKFANSDQEISSISYTLIVGGIDTRELRDLLLEALRDKRFRWDENQMLASVKNGELVIEKINTAKTLALIKKLQSHKFTLRWRQNVLLS